MIGGGTHHKQDDDGQQPAGCEAFGRLLGGDDSACSNKRDHACKCLRKSALNSLICKENLIAELLSLVC